MTTTEGNIFYHLSTADASSVLNAKSESVIESVNGVFALSGFQLYNNPGSTVFVDLEILLSDSQVLSSSLLQFTVHLR